MGKRGEFERLGDWAGAGTEIEIDVTGAGTETGHTSRRRSSPAYSPSISSGPNNTVPLRNISPSSSTQLFDLSNTNININIRHPYRPNRDQHRPHDVTGTNVPVRR